MNKIFYHLMFLCLLLPGSLLSQGLYSLIMDHIGVENFNKLDTAQARIFANSVDSFLISPIKGENKLTDFFITDLKNIHTSYWVSFSTTGSPKIKKIRIESANKKNSTILHLDSTERMVRKQETIVSGTISSREKFHPATAPLFMVIFQETGEPVNLMNLEWIINSDKLIPAKSGTFGNRYISVNREKPLLLEIEFDNSKDL